MTSSFSTRRVRIPAVATAFALLGMFAVVTGCNLLIPGVPRAATATAGDRSAIVTWAAPTFNSTPAPTGYVVGYDGGPEIVFNSTAIQQTITGLTNARSYSFWVRAFNGNGRGPAMEARPVWPGPAGPAFYTPPSPLPTGAPGDIIWAPRLTSTAVLPDAATNTLVLYHSTSVVDGRDVAESATVAIPQGQPSEGDWPVIAWAHGASGVADQCVLSALDTNYAGDTLNEWVKRGFVVVQTDYEGMGTPGPNPGWIGESEARSVIDSVRAARNLDDRVGNRWVAMGHSLGGQAALFTADLAARRAPDLVLVGTVALASASGSADKLRIFAAYPTAPLYDFNLAMELYGAAAVYPDVRPETLLTASALDLYGQVDQMCIAAVQQAWSFRLSSDTFQPGADVQPLITAFDTNEPGRLHLGTLPVLIAQGTADFGVYPNPYTAMVQSLQANGATNTTYALYPADHRGVIAASLPDVEQWVDARLAEHPITTPTS